LSQPACTTLPMTISSTCCGSMPARRTASATTFAPSSAQAPLEFSDGESGRHSTSQAVPLMASLRVVLFRDAPLELARSLA
jgi:hypothetical protein